jgi:hypothetical protein
MDIDRALSIAEEPPVQGTLPSLTVQSRQKQRFETNEVYFANCLTF